MKFGKVELTVASDREPLTIAEIGVNHNGQIELAKALILSARYAGADIVKLQAFVSEEEISKFAEKCEYQKDTTGVAGSQLEMAKALELSFDELKLLAGFCDEHDIPWLFTAFESISLGYLVNTLGIKSLKIASSEVTNIPFLREIAEYGLDVILSSGASTMDEVAVAVQTLQEHGAGQVALLHCVSSYPTPPECLNLSAIGSMRERFDLPVGFSDHTNGYDAAGFSVLCGGCLVEKHITLDTRMDGPDHMASVTPDDFAKMVQRVKQAYICRGNGVKQPASCELDNLPLIRKSIVARNNMSAGHLLGYDDLAFKRPGEGIPPGDYEKVIGCRLTRDFAIDEPLEWSGLES